MLMLGKRNLPKASKSWVCLDKTKPSEMVKSPMELSTKQEIELMSLDKC